LNGAALDLDRLRDYLLNKTAVTEGTPFGPDSLVYKVMGKMFALIAWETTPLQITLKSDPDDALALRAMYPAVRPGYYMNKQFWNTITLDGSIPEDEILEMIDISYDLVVKGLKKADRFRLTNQSKGVQV
jgi:predicted DNA-binding protein (MmcQ/YjbR family)